MLLWQVLFLLICCLRPDSEFYMRLSAIAHLEFPLSSGTGDRFQQAELFFLPGLVPFISLLLGNWNLFILVQAEVQLAAGLWAVRTEVTFTVWNSFDAVWILLIWDAAGETPVTAQLVEALVWKTQTFGGPKADKSKPLVFFSLDVVVPKSLSRAQLLGLDCSERLGSAPDEMGIPQLHCFPSMRAAFRGQGFLIPHICHVSPCALLPPCQHSQNLECFLSAGSRF